MQLKAGIKYQLSDTKRALIIFYGILYGLLVLFLLINLIFHEQASMEGGIETASMIFLFVAGLNSFKGPFRMFLQNGRSRQTLFFSFLVSVSLIAVFMTLMDMVTGWVYGAVLPGDYQSVYMDRFASLYTAAGGSGTALVDSLVWSFFTYLMMGTGGFFLSSLYYRMTKPLKLLVSIGVPVLLFIVIPTIDALYTQGAIMKFFGNVLAYALGYGSIDNLVAGLFSSFITMQNQISLYPYRAVLFSFGFSALVSGLSFLLVRRATVKE